MAGTMRALVGQMRCPCAPHINLAHLLQRILLLQWAWHKLQEAAYLGAAAFCSSHILLAVPPNLDAVSRHVAFLL